MPIKKKKYPHNIVAPIIERLLNTFLDNYELKDKISYSTLEMQDSQYPTLVHYIVAQDDISFASFLAAHWKNWFNLQGMVQASFYIKSVEMFNIFLEYSIPLNLHYYHLGRCTIAEHWLKGNIPLVRHLLKIGTTTPDRKFLCIKIPSETQIIRISLKGISNTNPKDPEAALLFQELISIFSKKQLLELASGKVDLIKTILKGYDINGLEIFDICLDLAHTKAVKSLLIDHALIIHAGTKIFQTFGMDWDIFVNNVLPYLYKYETLLLCIGRSGLYPRFNIYSIMSSTLLPSEFEHNTDQELKKFCMMRTISNYKKSLQVQEVINKNLRSITMQDFIDISNALEILPLEMMHELLQIADNIAMYEQPSDPEKQIELLQNWVSVNLDNDALSCWLQISFKLCPYNRYCYLIRTSEVGTIIESLKKNFIKEQFNKAFHSDNSCALTPLEQNKYGPIAALACIQYLKDTDECYQRALEQLKSIHQWILHIGWGKFLIPLYMYRYSPKCLELVLKDFYDKADRRKDTLLKILKDYECLGHDLRLTIINILIEKFKIDPYEENTSVMRKYSIPEKTLLSVMQQHCLWEISYMTHKNKEGGAIFDIWQILKIGRVISKSCSSKTPCQYGIKCPGHINKTDFSKLALSQVEKLCDTLSADDPLIKTFSEDLFNFIKAHYISETTKQVRLNLSPEYMARFMRLLKDFRDKDGCAVIMNTDSTGTYITGITDPAPLNRYPSSESIDSQLTESSSSSSSTASTTSIPDGSDLEVLEYFEESTIPQSLVAARSQETTSSVKDADSFLEILIELLGLNPTLSAHLKVSEGISPNFDREQMMTCELHTLIARMFPKNIPNILVEQNPLNSYEKGEIAAPQALMIAEPANYIAQVIIDQERNSGHFVAVNINPSTHIITFLDGMSEPLPGYQGTVHHLSNIFFPDGNMHEWSINPIYLTLGGHSLQQHLPLGSNPCPYIALSALNFEIEHPNAMTSSNIPESYVQGILSYAVHLAQHHDMPADAEVTSGFGQAFPTSNPDISLPCALQGNCTTLPFFSFIE